ncbi:HAD hydrolase-like protein [Pediococcus claussenii]|uniref:HAD hydrolase, IA, variant 1 family protein n=1 Tax=Pediococcus claussenii (strain ATCC BAA-344 / DSM 14800 / JCM 18046 / KCTC 3811 / LMG 21948 / P06) TaxID=701521 RepID=G8PD96_PEDCP|nr:HAD hydrolase-like protein [Pediococcus claussenii]AEV95231.1 HAD hydrolase, IA, variant 1 family protein [Pediococcus claussenii ATCC BAA-344]ANZ70460.1 serine phosphatase [Pediococcus claussenii]ANZ72275.1 serine phosphatase [Pediococcus claussenii]KRN19586.1 hypothetical protein IV79_GL001303 [Pediococcus claussenii]
MEIFYDFDGTLFDTYPAMVRAFNSLGKFYGKTVDSREVYLKMRRHSFGFTLNEFAQENDLDANLAEKKFREYERTELQSAKPFPNVVDLLKQNIAKGGENFLLTHRNEEVNQLLEKEGMLSLFTGFVNGSMTFPRKPDPASLNFLINKFKVNKKAAWMIGDRNLDIDAAHNAEIKGILFDYDNIIDPTSNPEYRVDTFSEIIDLFNELR